VRLGGHPRLPQPAGQQVPGLGGGEQVQAQWVGALGPDHLGIETFDDTAAQIAWSHHWIEVDGRLVRHSAPYRYVWPSELDLMAKITGFRVRDRWAGWDQAPFTSASHSQVAVFEKLPPPPVPPAAPGLPG